MLPSPTKLRVAILTITAATAHAQTATCVNDAPNPYHLVNDWAHLPRPMAATNNVNVDAHDNIWVADRCEDSGCAASRRPVTPDISTK